MTGCVKYSQCFRPIIIEAYAQNETPGQIEELHAGERDQFVGDLIIEAFHFRAPRLTGHDAYDLDDPLRLVMNLRRIQRDHQRASDQEEQREPEVDRVIRRR